MHLFATTLCILSSVFGVRYSFYQTGIPDTVPACSNIDVVYTWVNGSLSPEPSTGDSDTLKAQTVHRFRNFNEIYYSMKGVERYMPYVNKIYIVTNGERISWLDLAEWRITIEYVDHSIILPPNYSPSQNSIAIETFLHKIPGLSEFYVYLNDDVLVTNYIHPQLLFGGGVEDVNGCYILEENKTYYGAFFVENRRAPDIRQYGQWKNKCGHYFAIQNSNILVDIIIGSASDHYYPKHGPAVFRRSVLSEIEPLLRNNARSLVRSRHSISVINTEGYLAANNHFSRWKKHVRFDDEGLIAYVPLRNSQSLAALQNELDRRPLTLCINDILEPAYDNPETLAEFVSILYKILNAYYETDVAWKG